MNIRLGKIAGTPIILTNNLMVYAGIYALITLAQQGIAATGMLLLGMTAVAVCVLLHELGHVTAGKRYGIRPIDIRLNFFGGIASNNPRDWYWLMDRPKKAIVIWFCGPLVNIVLYGLLTLGIYFAAPIPWLADDLAWIRTFNLVMAVFNLLPMYPMDGGGILYCILRMITHKARAIKITSIVGMIVAAGVFALAIKFHAFVACLIAGVVFYEAYKAPKSPLFR